WPPPPETMSAASTPEPLPSTRSLSACLFLASGAIVVFELLLTRLFALVLFAPLANLGISLALLGIGIGATALHLFPGLVPREKLGSRVGWLVLLAGLS